MVGSIIQLARWLGPWADANLRPDARVIDDTLGTMKVRVYRPAAPGRTGQTYLIAQGLHYAAADDPRMDRFCRILTTAGHSVIVPFVPDYLALVPTERAKRDFAAAFEALPRWSDRKPIVFSISFGSLLAFALAAEHGAGIERLVIFGGYFELRETLEFCFTGKVGARQAARDPMNQSVVLLNLLELVPCADRVALAAAWRRFVERTWGRAELKRDERYQVVAKDLLPEVPEAVRELFLIGVGVLPGGRELVFDALDRFDASALDPAPYLPRITNRVDLVHGTDDDVIPYEHSQRLAAALVNADVRLHITGVYGHTGSQRPPLSSAAREMLTMLRVLRALA
ncbi:MAG TPA: alpha/beta hydrolase [Kofleriaceae bacterium]